jgi:hypothetical protein
MMSIANICGVKSNPMMLLGVRSLASAKKIEGECRNRLFSLINLLRLLSQFYLLANANVEAAKKLAAKKQRTSKGTEVEDADDIPDDEPVSNVVNRNVAREGVSSVDWRDLVAVRVNSRTVQKTRWCSADEFTEDHSGTGKCERCTLVALMRLNLAVRSILFARIYGQRRQWCDSLTRHHFIFLAWYRITCTGYAKNQIVGGRLRTCCRVA